MGRYCIAQALKQMGHAPIQVESHADRSPIWPSGWIGSLTHTDDFAMAAVGLTEQVGGIGIDAEDLSRSTQIEKTTKSFASDDEIRIGLNAQIPIHLWSFIIFSAKESLFKCLYPLRREFFGFDSARLNSVSLRKFDSSSTFLKVQNESLSGEFELKLIQGKNGVSAGTGFRGQFSVNDAKVQTLIKFVQ
jgi:4'-phosphopantetheinyl transferase EntD